MRVYFDNAATTPLNPKIFEKMKPFLTEEFGNPSSIHSFGRKARVAIEEAREIVAEFINANPNEIYFTSGGTEANNFVVRGIARTEFFESKRYNIITSKAEHHSVMDSFVELANNGFSVNWLNIKRDTTADLKLLERLIVDSTSLISLIHVNNETGAVNPIKEISSLVNRKNIYFHTDAVQAAAALDLDVNKLGVDLLSLSAHKIQGPKGTGILYLRRGVPFLPQQAGGSQESNRRAGTENVPGIVGAAVALDLAAERRQSFNEHCQRLSQRLIDGIMSKIERVRLNGHPTQKLPGHISLCFEFIEGESVLLHLDFLGVAASSGSACTSASLDPSHVLLAMGVPAAIARGGVRFSLGLDNTEEEIDFVISSLVEIIKQLRAMSPLTPEKMRAKIQ